MHATQLIDKLPAEYKIFAGPGKMYTIKKNQRALVSVMTATDLVDLLIKMIPITSK